MSQTIIFTRKTSLAIVLLLVVGVVGFLVFESYQQPPSRLVVVGNRTYGDFTGTKQTYTQNGIATYYLETDTGKYHLVGFTSGFASITDGTQITVRGYQTVPPTWKGIGITFDGDIDVLAFR